MLLWTLICPKLACFMFFNTSLLLYAMKCVENLKLNVKVFVCISIYVYEQIIEIFFVKILQYFLKKIWLNFLKNIAII